MGTPSAPTVLPVPEPGCCCEPHLLARSPQRLQLSRLGAALVTSVRCQCSRDAILPQYMPTANLDGGQHALAGPVLSGQDTSPSSS